MKLRKFFNLALIACTVLFTVPALGLTAASAASNNLVPNPSVETANPNNPTLPLDWNEGGSWGNLDATYSYLTNGEAGNRSIAVQITSYTSGDAKWYFDPVTITPNTSYTFSDYYKSTIPSDVMVQYTDSAGNDTYQDLGGQAVSGTWKQSFATFTAPASAVQATVFHLISAVGSLQTDNYSLTTTTTPLVDITKPTNNSTVSGTVAAAATATDSVGIKSVQFDVDGTLVGTAGPRPAAISPYTYQWDSATVTNGNHTITAVAESNANVTSQASITVTVNNAGNNLVANPSLETIDPNNPDQPADWQPSSWGTNSTTFSYLHTGHTGNRSVQVQMTQYTDGDAKWYFDPIAVTPDTQYQFSDYYQSTVNTELDVAFQISDGTMTYQIIGLPDTANQWTQFSTTFSVPLGAETMTVYHLIHSVGSLTIDDVNLHSYTPVGFNRALVTLTFDDGYNNDYTNALPILQQFGFDSTQFIITGDVGQSGYMTPTQVKAMSQAGQEVASHTVTHTDLLDETPAQVQIELQQSQAQLEQWIGQPVTDLAFPNGLYDSAIVAQTKQYYQASRGVEDGLNSADNFNPYDIKVQNVFNTTTTAQIQDWVKQAQQTNTWLVLVYHSVRAQQGTGDIYNVTPAQLTDQLSAVKTSGVVVTTMEQALAELMPQVGK